MRPKVQKTVHYCDKTSIHSEMVYHDATSLTGFPTSAIYPTKDLEGNPLTTEFGLSTYDDHQTLVIQEMPERAPAGLLPSSIDVVLDSDLVDQCKPGDRVSIVGVYRALPSKSQGQTSGIFKSVLIANHVRHLGKSVGANDPITSGDMVNINKVAARNDVFDLLGRSVAPSIFGHESVEQKHKKKKQQQQTTIAAFARARFLTCPFFVLSLSLSIPFSLSLSLSVSLSLSSFLVSSRKHWYCFC